MQLVQWSRGQSEGHLPSRLSQQWQSSPQSQLWRVCARLSPGSVPEVKYFLMKDFWRKISNIFQLLWTLGLHSSRVHHHGHSLGHHQPVRLRVLHRGARGGARVIRHPRDRQEVHVGGGECEEAGPGDVWLQSVEQETENHHEEQNRATLWSAGLEETVLLLHRG